MKDVAYKQHVGCLQAHGFMVNEVKSSLTPKQETEQLGIQINTRTCRVSVARQAENANTTGQSGEGKQADGSYVPGETARDNSPLSKNGRKKTGFSVSFTITAVKMLKWINRGFVSIFLFLSLSHTHTSNNFLSQQFTNILDWEPLFENCTHVVNLGEMFSSKKYHHCDTIK